MLAVDALDLVVEEGELFSLLGVLLALAVLVFRRKMANAAKA